MMTVGRSSYEVHKPHTDTHPNQRWKYLYTHTNKHTYSHRERQRNTGFHAFLYFPHVKFKESNRGNRLQSQIDIESIEPTGSAVRLRYSKLSQKLN